MSTAPSKPASLQVYTVVGEKPDSILQNLLEIWRFRSLIAELVMRELKVRYKNRVGGVLWSLFAPLLQVATITVMSKLFLTPVDNYSAYLMAVMFLWQYFQNTVLDASGSIVQNALLVRKIYFPRAILPIVSMLVNLMHFCISMTLTVAYLFVLGTYPSQLRWEFIMVAPVILGLSMLALGVGFMTAKLSTMYEDFRFLSVTALNLLFYALPILYPIEKVYDRHAIYPFYMLNPVASYLVAFQRALLLPPDVKVGARLLASVDVPWGFVGIAACVSVLFLGLGYYIFERSKWTLMERL